MAPFSSVSKEYEENAPTIDSRGFPESGAASPASEPVSADTPNSPPKKKRKKKKEKKRRQEYQPKEPEKRERDHVRRDIVDVHGEDKKDQAAADVPPAEQDEQDQAHSDLREEQLRKAMRTAEIALALSNKEEKLQQEDQPKEPEKREGDQVRRKTVDARGEDNKGQAAAVPAGRAEQDQAHGDLRKQKLRKAIRTVEIAIALSNKEGASSKARLPLDVSPMIMLFSFVSLQTLDRLTLVVERTSLRVRRSRITHDERDRDICVPRALSFV